MSDDTLKAVDATKAVKARAPQSRSVSRASKQAPQSRSVSRASKEAKPKIHVDATPSNLAQSLSAHLSNSVVMAVKKGDLEALKKCVEGHSSFDVISMLNWTDRNGSTPIFHCAWSGRAEMIDWMIHHYADPHWANFRKNYPIDMSIETMSVDAIKVFLEHGAEITKEKWIEIKPRMKLRTNYTGELEK
jgi:ankyrin repeat protein